MFFIPIFDQKKETPAFLFDPNRQNFEVNFLNNIGGPTTYRTAMAYTIIIF